MTFTRFSLSILLFLVCLTNHVLVWSFQAPAATIRSRRLRKTTSNTRLYNAERSTGRMERLEYTIYPDGRVEEKVIGVKGSDCEKITEAVHEALGKVVSSEPTEEMFEEKVIQKEVINIKEENGWEGTSTW